MDEYVRLFKPPDSKVREHAFLVLLLPKKKKKQKNAYERVSSITDISGLGVRIARDRLVFHMFVSSRHQRSTRESAARHISPPPLAQIAVGARGNFALHDKTIRVKCTQLQSSNSYI